MPEPLDVFDGVHDIARGIDHPFQVPSLGLLELGIEELCVKLDDLSVQELHVLIKIRETAAPGQIFFKGQAVVKDQLGIDPEGPKAVKLTLLKEVKDLLAQGGGGRIQNFRRRIIEIDSENLLVIGKSPDQEAGEESDKGKKTTTPMKLKTV